MYLVQSPRELKFATRHNTPTAHSVRDFYPAHDFTPANEKSHKKSYPANRRKTSAHHRKNSVDTESEDASSYK
jgi:hypothetical protein